jgi:CheY-like chemotaxis protein
METVPKKILILDDNKPLLRRAKDIIERHGNYNCSLAHNVYQAYEVVSNTEFELLLVDIHLKRESGGEDDGIEFIHNVRTDGFDRLAMVISGDKSCEQFVKAAHAGSNDYWLKLSSLNLQDAVNLIMMRRESGPGKKLRPTKVIELCFFRCVGFKQNDCMYMQKFYDMNFPTFEKLAEAMSVSHEAVKTRFSRIYDRLGIEGSSQLIEVLMACSFYRR